MIETLGARASLHMAAAAMCDHFQGSSQTQWGDREAGQTEQAPWLMCLQVISLWAPHEVVSISRTPVLTLRMPPACMPQSDHEMLLVLSDTCRSGPSTCKSANTLAVTIVPAGWKHGQCVKKALPNSPAPVICPQVVLKEFPKPKKRRPNGGNGADGALAKRSKKIAQSTHNTCDTTGSGGGGGDGGGSSTPAGKAADAMPASTAGDPNAITNSFDAADAADANGLPADRSKLRSTKRAGKAVRTFVKGGTNAKDDNHAGASLGTQEEAVAATLNTNVDGANLNAKEGMSAPSIMSNAIINRDEQMTGDPAASQAYIFWSCPPALDHTSSQVLLR